MTRFRNVSVLVVAALLVGVGATACSKDDWPVQGEGAPSIDQSINGQVLEYLGDNDLPGATLAVTRNGRLVWSKAYGWANTDKQIRMKPWHRSRIGSVSKILTAIGLLQMLEPDGSTLGTVATGPSSLESKLAQKLYGHPGTDFTSPSWPTVSEATVLDDPESYWEAFREGVQDLYASTYESDMARMIEWGSKVELGHVLSHTSGLLRSGSNAEAMDYFDVEESELTYAQVHEAVLMATIESREDHANVKCYLDGSLYVDDEDPAFTGKEYQMPPLLFEPGTDRCYSNHGFGLLGHIIDERSGAGADNTYRRVIERNVLEPLGLTGVVPNNVDISELDAWPHGSALDPSNPSNLGMAAGGWSASAQDLVRVMCGLDRVGNYLRLLQPATVTTMESIAYPAADSDQPLGWDSRSGERLFKNGSVGGGETVIIKYLPGEFDAAPEDEINIAIAVNASAPSIATSTLRGIADKVAVADIPDDYDLFDPAYPCVVEKEPGLVAPTASPTDTPQPGATFVAPTTPNATPSPTRTRTPMPAPPTVLIRKPVAGQYPAPYGGASIDFSGQATDAAGKTIPGTNYRWTAIRGGEKTMLCAGSGIGPGTSPAASPSGLTILTDCASFTKKLTTTVIGAGPPTTILLEARDSAGTIGTATAVVTLFYPPTG